MRRPLLFLLFIQSFAILIGTYSRFPFLWAFLIAPGFFIYLKFLKGRGYLEKKRTLCLLLALIIFSLSLIQSNLLKNKSFDSEALDGKVASFTGKVTKARLMASYAELTVKLNFKEKLLVRYDNLEISKVYSLCGKEISFTGKISLPSGTKNPGDFNYSRYLKGKGIGAIAEVNAYKLTAKKICYPLRNMLSVLKGNFMEHTKPLLSEESFGLMTGILFGEKGFLDSNLYEDFQANGIAHILAVSGLHVGFIYQILQKLSGGKKTLITGILTFLGLFFYAALSNFSVSVIRAALMISFQLLAFYLHRRYDMVSAASLAAIFLLYLNPYNLFDSGFQLSFAAAYTLGIILPYMENKVLKYSDLKKSNLLYRIGMLSSPAISIQIGMFPLSIYHFLHYSPLTMFINPFAIALAGLILPSGLVLFAAFWIEKALGFGHFLCIAAAGPLEGFCKILNFICEFFNNLCGKIYASPLPITALFLYYALLFWFFSETRHILRRKGQNLATSIILLILIFNSCLFPWVLGISNTPFPWDYGRCQLSFLDVGQGDAIHLSIRGKNVLIDGGGSKYKNVGEKTLLPYLLKNGVRGLELCIVTHLDTDHSKGLMELSQLIPVKCFAFPSCCKDEDLEAFKSENKIFLSKGDEIKLFDDYSLLVLSSSLSSSENENSLVLYMKTKSFTALFCGDAGFETEEKLLKSGKTLKADIIKLGHHGSKNSTSENFLKAVDPSLAVISCGKNNSYGHPADRVINLLENLGIEYKRTDQNGAVLCKK